MDESAYLPPFAALRAFQAAARHGQIREAAKDLGITESAVSHQVRKLEDFLRLALFHRSGPRVQLTEAGARYYADIDPALSGITDATRALIGPKERGRVTITLPPSLAILWLIPRMVQLEAAAPGIDLHLITTTTICDLNRKCWSDLRKPCKAHV